MQIRRALAGLAITGLLGTNAFAAEPSGGAPETVSGKVTKVDSVQKTVTVRGADGKDHEFTASDETLRNLKPGDRIEAKKRPDQTK